MVDEVARESLPPKVELAGEAGIGYLCLEPKEPSFKSLQKALDMVKASKVKGVEGITRALLKKKDDQWVIFTEGSNLREVLKIDGLDHTRAYTNSIQEIHEVLGVEAARNSIIEEASRTLDEQGLSVDIRHIMLVADLMTADGDVKAIGRHGISGRKSSVLARAAFEITAAHLLTAAMTGEEDHLDGVAENIIVGQPVTLGTGAVNLVYAPVRKGASK
jgi:DNA-directed RNA polymerase subunit A"